MEGGRHFPTTVQRGSVNMTRHERGSSWWGCRTRRERVTPQFHDVWKIDDCGEIEMNVEIDDGESNRGRCDDSC